jgi:hypothetical protein
MNRAACTIVSLNYLPFARTLCDSYLQTHPDHKFFILLVDRLPEGFAIEENNFELILVEELAIPDFPSIAFRYNILELNTNVKPTFIKALLARGIDQLIYFDPDIMIYSRLDPVFESLDIVSIVLTPHSNTPNVGNPSSEAHLLRTGVFNLGFIAISNTPEALKFLDWWEQRCLGQAYDDRQVGTFVDQKWVNLVPCFFESYSILKHKGCNVAYWNLHERQVHKDQDRWVVNGSMPRVFSHFSGISADGSEITKHSAQFNLANRPELAEMFRDYRSRLISNGIKERNLPAYGFGQFSDGTLINQLQRAAFHANLDRFGSANPFDSNGPFYLWSRQNHLQSERDSSANYNKKTYSKTDSRVRFVNGMLRLILRLLGADRYSILMKYMSHVSNLRNQKDIFGEAQSR